MKRERLAHRRRQGRGLTLARVSRWSLATSAEGGTCRWSSCGRPHDPKGRVIPRSSHAGSGPFTSCFEPTDALRPRRFTPPITRTRVLFRRRGSRWTNTPARSPLSGVARLDLESRECLEVQSHIPGARPESLIPRDPECIAAMEATDQVSTAVETTARAFGRKYRPFKRASPRDKWNSRYTL
jgi:hypothetical protein